MWLEWKERTAEDPTKAHDLAVLSGLSTSVTKAN